MALLIKCAPVMKDLLDEGKWKGQVITRKLSCKGLCGKNITVGG